MRGESYTYLWMYCYVFRTELGVTLVRKIAEVPSLLRTMTVLAIAS